MFENNNAPDEQTPTPIEGWRAQDGILRQFTNGVVTREETNLDIIANLINLSDAVAKRFHDETIALRNEQIDGSDFRLTDFWAKAQELADNANHCQVFDEMAEALGGPRRERDYEVTFSFEVTVPVTYTVTVTSTNTDDAEDEAAQVIRGMMESEFAEFADWDNAEIETSGMYRSNIDLA